MPYTRAFSTLGCPAASLSDAISLARLHGIEALELRTLQGRTDLPDLWRELHGTPAALASVVAAEGIRIQSLDTSFRLFAAQEGDREALLAFVPWAEALGVRWLRVFDGGESLAGGLALATETLAWWRGLKRTRGWRVDLMVETHDVLLNAETIRRFESVCPGTALLWDSHHTWRRGGEDPVATWAAIHGHVVHVHVKDSIDEPGPRHPFTYCLPGTGRFPMAPLRARLAAEFGGTVCLEWERHWHPYLPPLELALASAAAIDWW